jgi:hypothetical protein
MHKWTYNDYRFDIVSVMKLYHRRCSHKSLTASFTFPLDQCFACISSSFTSCPWIQWRHDVNIWIYPSSCAVGDFTLTPTWRLIKIFHWGSFYIETTCLNKGDWNTNFTVLWSTYEAVHSFFPWTAYVSKFNDFIFFVI